MEMFKVGVWTSLRTDENDRKHTSWVLSGTAHWAMMSSSRQDQIMSKPHLQSHCISSMQVLLKMLPKYYGHVKEHENTLITKFFGLHRITINGRNKVPTLCYMPICLYHLSCWTCWFSLIITSSFIFIRYALWSWETCFAQN